MMILDILAAILFFAGAMLYSAFRLKTILQFFQQEEYDNARFFRLANRGRLVSLAHVLYLIGLTVLLALVIMFTEFPMGGIAVMLSGILLGVVGYFEKNPEKIGKKKLVMTARAQRIYSAAVLISALVGGLFLFLLKVMAPTLSGLSPAYIPLLAAFFTGGMPYFLIGANIAWQPYEKTLQIKFLEEAKQRLKQLDPQIIGITGSYGKTSTKHILSHVLGQMAPTIATPGSVNTEMGITRVIREQLKPEHKYMISEMGAYGPGSIAKLCRLTPPQSGILTAVGDAHYERFKSIDTVARAKLELYQAVRKKDGPFIIAADMVDAKYWPSYDKLILVGRDAGALDLQRDYLILDESLTADGIHMVLQSPKSGKQEIAAPLYGKHQVANVACVVALLEAIGFPVKDIIGALKTVPQVRHRLEVIKKEGQPTIIDDAYNANPHGFEAALEVMKVLLPQREKLRNGRRIVVTPGMLELGERHDEEHYIIGQRLAQTADTVIVIRQDRIPALVYGFRSVETSKAHLMAAESFEQAKLWLDENAQANDVILYENDLPDLYELGIAK